MRPSYLEELDFRSGSLLINTDVVLLSIVDGSIAYGLTEDLYILTIPELLGHILCTFSFIRIHLGGSVVVKLEGRNALALDVCWELGHGGKQGRWWKCSFTFGGKGILGGYSGVDAGNILGAWVLGHLNLLQQMGMGQPIEVMDLEMQDNMVIVGSRHNIYQQVQEDLQL